MKDDVLNPLTWNLSQWYDALLGAALTCFILGTVSVVTYIFH